jgi:hypothetical protein
MKRVLLTLMLVFSIQLAYAQEWKETWVYLDELRFDIGDPLVISKDGNTIVVGDRDGLGTGYVDIFKPGEPTSYTRLQGAGGEFFGASFAISDSADFMIVGAPTDGSGAGSAHIYQLNGNNWQPFGEALVGGEGVTRFGASVSMSGDGSRIAISNSGTWVSNSSPFVVVFRYDGTAWVPVGDTLRGPESTSNFGRNILLSQDGNTLIVASDHTETSDGRIYRYDWDGSSWQLTRNRRTQAREAPVDPCIL